MFYTTWYSQTFIWNLSITWCDLSLHPSASSLSCCAVVKTAAKAQFHFNVCRFRRCICRCICNVRLWNPGRLKMYFLSTFTYLLILNSHCIRLYSLYFLRQVLTYLGELLHIIVSQKLWLGPKIVFLDRWTIHVNTSKQNLVKKNIPSFCYTNINNASASKNNCINSASISLKLRLGPAAPSSGLCEGGHTRPRQPHAS